MLLGSRAVQTLERDSEVKGIHSARGICTPLWKEASRLLRYVQVSRMHELF